MPGQRLDKWLWCARLVRTRATGVRLIEAGKIRVNGTRAQKPSRLVKAGDVVTAASSGKLTVVRVIGASERRVSPSLARALYEDLTPPETRSPGFAFAGDGSRQGPRPTKRDRRRLDAVRGGASDL
jgi:ribosome-associated heat shock protein Hsp15